ncbi:MAG: MBL fold metallo-hydrolase [Burkholderiales bacterium]|nr:MBL fold metallo-hydrolase [Burkholderiales bacterium]
MKAIVKWLLGAATLAGVVGCATLLAPGSNPYFDAAKRHHTASGFRNNYPHATDQNFWKWQYERLMANVPAAPPPGGWASVLPGVTPEAEFLRQNRGERTLTWLGHATVLLQTSGVNVITDPMFSDRASPVSFAGPKRQVPLALRVDELPVIDVVFISHNHYDHLDADTVRAFSARFPGAVYVVPLGFKAWLSSHGVPATQVRELDWWDRVNVRGLDFTLVPAQHWSKRTLTDTNQMLWGGVAIEDRARGGTPVPWRFLYTGDTGYSQDFRDIGARFAGGFDWLAVPIGAYEPRWIMKAQHVNPDESVQIMKDVGARQALAVHWGTFVLTDEPLDQPPKDLAIALQRHGVPAAQFHVFKNGETRRL